MNKVMVGIGVVVGLGVAAVGTLAAIISSQPDHIHLERQVTVQAAAVDVAPFASDLKLVNAWSPWTEKDPKLTQAYSDTTSGVGAWYTWDGNDDVGSGRQEVTSVEPGLVTHELTFLEPMESKAKATIRFTESGGTTTITWAFDQSADFGAKAFVYFVDFDAMLGPDFERGLVKLKPLVEQAATKRQAAEAEKLAAAHAEQEPMAVDAP